MTNLAFTSSKNKYREMTVIPESISVENRRPPLKKLVRTINQRMVVFIAIRLTLSLKTNTSPDEGFQ